MECMKALSKIPTLERHSDGKHAARQWVKGIERQQSAEQKNARTFPESYTHR